MSSTLLENILVSVTVRCYLSDMACNHNGQNLGTGRGKLVNPSTMQAKIEVGLQYSVLPGGKPY